MPPLRTRVVRAAALIAVTSVGSTGVIAPGTHTFRQAAAPSCATGDDSAATAALNCMTLVPVPDLPAAHATIQLRPVASPFGVAVRVDGRPRYRLIATFGGLAPPRSLGPYAVYVAWAYTLSLDSAIKLGPVMNGVVDLGEIS